MLGRLISSSLKTFSRDRQALFFTFGFPLVMALLFGIGVGAGLKPMKIVVVQESKDETSKGFVDMLESSKQFEISKARTEDVARRKIQEGRLGVAVVIPDLSAGGNIALLFDERSPERLQRTTSAINGALQTYNLKLANAPQKLHLEVKGIRADRGIGDFDFLLPTLVMLGVIFSSMTGAASRMATFREQGAFKRLIVTPLEPKTFLAGDLVSRAVIAIPQIGLILAVGKFAYDATVNGSAVWIFVLGVIGTITFASLGVLIANYAKTAEAAGGIASAISTLMLFLGGLFPEDLFPKRITDAVAYTPFPLITEKIRTVVLDATMPFGNDKETILLAVWLFGSLAIAARTFRFKEPSRRSKKKTA
ncbi:MAG TPA: ABC transporter permease [Actinomycetota bacterium]|nr:ABC transporter permease [Actinomycetota bacterium]